MSDRHTPGPWKVVGIFIQRSDGWPIARTFRCTSGDPEEMANARLIAAAPDHASIAWALCVASARWVPWGDGRGEFCMNGLRHATKLDEFRVPEMTPGMRSAIHKARGES